jgi:predicted small secreted protein
MLWLISRTIDATHSFRLRSFSAETGENLMVRKVMTLVLIGSSLAIAACNTVRGAAKDVNSAANAVDNAT